MLCRAAWLAIVSHVGIRRGKNTVTASVSGLCHSFQWESNQVSFSTETDEQKRDMITQHQSVLTFIAFWDSNGYEGWKLTLKLPWQITYQICLYPRSHVGIIQTCHIHAIYKPYTNTQQIFFSSLSFITPHKGRKGNTSMLSFLHGGNINNSDAVLSEH